MNFARLRFASTKFRPYLTVLLVVLGGVAVVGFMLAVLYGVTRDVIRQWPPDRWWRLLVFLGWFCGWIVGIVMLINVAISMSVGIIEEMGLN